MINATKSTLSAPLAHEIVIREREKKTREEEERKAGEESDRIARERVTQTQAQEEYQPSVAGPKTVNFDCVFPFATCRAIWHLQ